MTDTPPPAWAPPIAAATDLGITPIMLTPIEAAARLKQLETDREWGDRLSRGDVQTTEEFTRLTALAASGNPIDQVMAGVEPAAATLDETNGSRASARDQVAFVADQRERGIPDRMIREVLSDLKPTLEQHRIGKENQRARFADAAWVERLKAGDPLATAEFLSNSWAIGCYEPPS